MRPCASTVTCSPSFELEAELTVMELPAASAIAVSEAASAKAAIAVPIARLEGRRRRDDRAICFFCELLIESPFVVVLAYLDAGHGHNLP